ncbi:MAG: hypothetical protein E6G01_14795 [Actinobacteria bacterium]|nr:MAG: hypothetical protein E6G01_14795 [Actinomycetota bacterium]
MSTLDRTPPSREGCELRGLIVAGLVTIAVGLLLGACGGGAQHGSTSATSEFSPPCPAGVGTAMARLVGTRAASVMLTSQSPGLVDCRYRAALPSESLAEEATVVLDAKPRAFQRFMNSITEREQTYVQSQDDPSHALQEISGVGIDADWTPARHELIAAGGDRFTIVTITQQAPTAPAELTAAEQLARAALRDAATQPPTRSGPQPP